MHPLRTAPGIVCLLLLGLTVLAAEPRPEPATLLSTRGKLLFADDFKQPLGKEWRTAKGKWEIVDGALRGAELKADKHGAVTRHLMPFRDVVIQYSFKLEGARQTSLSINDARGHCCRLLVNATGFEVRKDSHDHNMADKTVVLERRALPIQPGTWHTVVVEIRGKEMLARLDGAAVAYGAHETLAVDKTNFGLTVAGESASFKDLRVWEALPNSGWEATRSKLLEERARSQKSGS